MDNLEQYYVKTCPKCKQTKSFNDFYYSEATRNKCDIYCKECKRLRYKASTRIRKNSEYKRHYNITIEQTEELIRWQKGCCYLCDNALPSNPTHQHVEHDKATGRVFGVACRSCNLGISYFKHDPYLMVKVAKRMLRLRIVGGKL